MDELPDDEWEQQAPDLNKARGCVVAALIIMMTGALCGMAAHALILLLGVS